MGAHALARTMTRRLPRDPAAQAMLIAARIEPDAALRQDWYHHDPIRDLQGMTAERAIANGHAADLVRVLRAIEAGVRDR